MRLLLLAFTASLAAPSYAEEARTSACGAPEHRQFDFWVGDWDVSRAAGGALAGRNRIERILDGCALQESWTSARGRRGTSLNWWDPASKRWHQLWVDDEGLVLRLEGSFRDGSMVLEGEASGKGQPERHRVTWTPLAGGKVRQIWEASTDGGHAWRTLFDGIYARRG